MAYNLIAYSQIIFYILEVPPHPMSKKTKNISSPSAIRPTPVPRQREMSLLSSPLPGICWCTVVFEFFLHNVADFLAQHSRSNHHIWTMAEAQVWREDNWTSLCQVQPQHIGTKWQPLTCSFLNSLRQFLTLVHLYILIRMLPGELSQNSSNTSWTLNTQFMKIK